MKAVTNIPKKFILGFFKKKKTSNVYVKGFFNFKIGKKSFIVAHPLSLMNKANTFPNSKDREEFSNCKVFYFGGFIYIIQLTFELIKKKGLSLFFLPFLIQNQKK